MLLTKGGEEGRGWGDGVDASIEVGNSYEFG